MEENKKGEAIPFIINRQGEFVVAEEATSFLRTLSGRKLGIVCIVGKYRTGKSYLINKVILERTNNDGFKVGPTVNPCTKVLHRLMAGIVDLEPYAQGKDARRRGHRPHRHGLRGFRRHGRK